MTRSDHDMGRILTPLQALCKLIAWPFVGLPCLDISSGRVDRACPLWWSTVIPNFYYQDLVWTQFLFAHKRKHSFWVRVGELDGSLSLSRIEHHSIHYLRYGMLLFITTDAHQNRWWRVINLVLSKLFLFLSSCDWSFRRGGNCCAKNAISLYVAVILSATLATSARCSTESSSGSLCTIYVHTSQ